MFKYNIIRDFCVPNDFEDTGMEQKEDIDEYTLAQCQRCCFTFPVLRKNLSLLHVCPSCRNKPYQKTSSSETQYWQELPDGSMLLTFFYNDEIYKVLVDKVGYEKLKGYQLRRYYNKKRNQPRLVAFNIPSDGTYRAISTVLYNGARWLIKPPENNIYDYRPSNVSERQIRFNPDKIPFIPFAHGKYQARDEYNVFALFNSSIFEEALLARIYYEAKTNIRPAVTGHPLTKNYNFDIISKDRKKEIMLYVDQRIKEHTLWLEKNGDPNRRKRERRRLARIKSENDKRRESETANSGSSGG